MKFSRQLLAILTLAFLASCAPGKPEEKATIAAIQNEIPETQVVDPKLKAKLDAQPEQKEQTTANLLVEARKGENKIFLKAAFFKPAPRNPLFPNLLMPPHEENEPGHGHGEGDHKH